jgi:hypothetical protein
MIALLRREALLIALTIGLVGLAVASASHLPPAAQRQPSDHPLIGQLALAPDEQSEVLQQRMATKEKVIERLVEEELTLLQAAAWFRFLNDNPPEYPSDFRHRYPGNSDAEKACRQVLAWLNPYLRRRLVESQAATTLCRLEGELEVLLAENGNIELPW